MSLKATGPVIMNHRILLGYRNKTVSSLCQNPQVLTLIFLSEATVATLPIRRTHSTPSEKPGSAADDNDSDYASTENEIYADTAAFSGRLQRRQ